MEELARGCVATAFIVGQLNGFGAKAIALFGTEAQRSRYLPGIIRDARGFCIGDGTTQIQKNIIAKHLDRGQ